MNAPPPSTRPLDGRTAVVTGGGRGIGAAVAASLHGLGARVVLMGRTEESLARHADRLGEGARYRALDVTDAERVAAVFAELASGGGPDILVNNAGGTDSAPFTATSEDAWRRTMAVNLDGAFHCCRAVVPGMVERGWGRIVNVASTAALRGYPYVAAYCAAKHGLLGLTRALAVELGAAGVTVNAVCPGFTETDLLRDSVERIVASTGRDEEAARRALLRGNPQRRFVETTEVAAAVAWLVGPGGAAVNGQAVAVDGGETA